MIRPAVPEDAVAVCSIWNWMIRDTLSTFTTVEKTPYEIEALIKARKDAFFVAVDRSQCSGFVTFGAFRPGPGYAATVEHSIVVHPDMQGRGVGHALIQTAINVARDQGKHAMVAAISSANPDAIQFHAALGFKDVGCLLEVGRKHGQWLDLVLMQKNLSDPA